MNFDKIIIKSLKVKIYIGCTEVERSQAQNLELDLEIYVELQKAGRSGSLADTICYHTVCKDIQALADSKAWILLEELAEACADKLFSSFQSANSIKIQVRKFILPQTEYTAIEILRSRN